MNKKQKKVLKRIIVAAVLLVIIGIAGSVVSIPKWLEFLFYLVPYFLMLAFGHHEVDFFSVMAASAFVQLLSSAVPLPGGTGGAEGGFALFLGHFFGSASTAGYLLWRLITFIAPTILAAPLLGLRAPTTRASMRAGIA